jgi:hypothetical protein
MHVRQLTDNPSPAQNEFVGVMFALSRHVEAGDRMIAARFGDTKPITDASPNRNFRPYCASQTKHREPGFINPSDFKAKNTRKEAPSQLA